MTDRAQIEELLRLGIAAAKGGDQDKARPLLEQVVELDPGSEQGWLWLSGAVDSLDERHECLEHVVAINPSNRHAQAGLRWLRLQTKPAAEKPLAIHTSSESAERCPQCGGAVPPEVNECPHCHRPVTMPCPECGQDVNVDQTTCPHCGQDLGEVGEGTFYFLALAEAYAGRRKMEPMRRALAYARKEAQGDPLALQALADLYQQSGERDLAIETYETALGQDPENARLLARLSVLYEEQAQPERAREAYDLAVQHAGEDPVALRELAQIQLRQEGDTDQALAFLDRAIRQNPKDPRISMLLGDAHRMRADPARAINYYRRAVELAPPDSDIALEAKNHLSLLRAGLAEEAGEVEEKLLPDETGERRRPGCLTVYALLVAISGALGILVAGSLAGLFATNWSLLQQALSAFSAYGLPITVEALSSLVWVYVAVVGVSGLLGVGIAIGLWRLKNWARIVVIVLQTVAVLSTVAAGARLAAVSIGGANPPIAFLAALLIVFAIQAYILVWFVANRDRFH